MMKKSAFVFGAGCAGLSAAHYLNKAGYNVTVFEALDVPGGLARSERRPQDNGMPSEYSWRGFGPWYKNTFEVMQEIPYGPTNVFIENLSGQMHFHQVSDFKPYKSTIDSLELTKLEISKVGWAAAKTVLASHERSAGEYAKKNAFQELAKIIPVAKARNVSSVFGPFVGTDWERASVHHVSEFFRKNFAPGPPAPYLHPKTQDHEEFTQGGFNGWLILNRPSNEAWFEPWISLLRRRGVTFCFNAKLNELQCDADDKRVSRINLVMENKEYEMCADNYVIAMDPFSSAAVLQQSSSEFLQDLNLAKFLPLIQQGEHIQISFRIAFGEKCSFPERQTAVVLVRSEFDITLFSQDQLFAQDVNLGKGIKSLWSGTATVDSVAGKLFGLEMKRLTRDQFEQEIWYQLCRCQGLQSLLDQEPENQCRKLADFKIVRFEVWHAWVFPTKEQQRLGILVHSLQPKWVNSTQTADYQPYSKTAFSNLVLAGAHIQTSADLYSMEAAVESGRRAADIISNSAPSAQIQHMPMFLLPFQKVDSLMYAGGLPNLSLHLMIGFLILLIVLALGSSFMSSTSNNVKENVFLLILITVCVLFATAMLILYWKRRKTIQDNLRRYHT